jgi:hypothetical protein
LACKGSSGGAAGDATSRLAHEGVDLESRDQFAALLLRRGLNVFDDQKSAWSRSIRLTNFTRSA